MAVLVSMPEVVVQVAELAPFGKHWKQNGENLSRTPPYSSGELGKVFDNAIGRSLAVMLGNIPIVAPNSNSLTPSLPDCVEVGNVRVVGGVRPQNFDVGYRPDGIRFAFDSKTLNEKKSIGKNWQNMVNDLATEATTVHSRFPYALVGFLVAIPAPCLTPSVFRPLTETLERLNGRDSINGPAYMAEAISLVVWNPEDGTIRTDVPHTDSLLRLERFSMQIEAYYVDRYKGLPPHTD